MKLYDFNGKPSVTDLITLGTAKVLELPKTRSGKCETCGASLWITKSYPARNSTEKYVVLAACDRCKEIYAVHESADTSDKPEAFAPEETE